MRIFLLNMTEYMNLFVKLLAVINPISVIPIFISLTKNYNNKEKNHINLVSNLSVIIILHISLFFGNFILNLFNISIDSFRIAGGILLIMLSISMNKGNLVKNNDITNISKKYKNNISIIPLALPLLAGPGAISTVIIYGSLYKNNIHYILMLSTIIVIFSLFCYFLFKSSNFLVKIIGKTGIDIISKIMSLILMSIGIEFIISSIKKIFNLL